MAAGSRVVFHVTGPKSSSQCTGTTTTLEQGVRPRYPNIETVFYESAPKLIACRTSLASAVVQCWSCATFRYEAVVILIYSPCI